ncbi:uncharacterized protein LOC132200381 isoform X2 [Neocloeon triangulifer]|nr:uncharacterized protein LOC132200381 isoform X2 [Neocloeon triangulifer]
MNPADNPADAGPAGPALAAVPNRPPLYTTGLAPKKIKLLRRKCRAPSNLELRNKMRKLDLKQVLQLNGQKFLSSQNKASLVQQVFNLLQEVDRFTEPPLHVSLTMPKPPL